MVYGVNERSSERDEIINRLIEQQFSYKMENCESSDHRTKKKKKRRKDGERRKLAKDRVQPIRRFAVDALFYLVDVFVKFTVVACNFSRVDL